MTVVSCFRCAQLGKTQVGYRSTAIESTAFTSERFLSVKDGAPSIRVDVDLCGACRTRAATENSKAQSRRQGRDTMPPGATQ